MASILSRPQCVHQVVTEEDDGIRYACRQAITWNNGGSSLMKIINAIWSKFNISFVQCGIFVQGTLS